MLVDKVKTTLSGTSNMGNLALLLRSYITVQITGTSESLPHCFLLFCRNFCKKTVEMEKLMMSTS